MTQATNENRIKEVMSRVFGIPVESIENDASPDTIENWDSLRHITLVLALEEEFGVEFNEDQIVAIMSFPQIKAVLQEHGIELT